MPTGPAKLQASLESIRMSRLRLLLFWLLMLAVPLQGFAATSKLLCDSAHGAHGYSSTHLHAQKHAHQHAQHVDAASQAAAHADDPSLTAATTDGASHQCGLCAACCHAVAIAHQYQPVFASPAPQADIPEISARIPSRGLRLPEKPPRA